MMVGDAAAVDEPTDVPPLLVGPELQPAIVGVAAAAAAITARRNGTCWVMTCAPGRVVSEQVRGHAGSAAGGARGTAPGCSQNTGHAQGYTWTVRGSPSLETGDRGDDPGRSRCCRRASRTDRRSAAISAAAPMARKRMQPAMTAVFVPCPARRRPSPARWSSTVRAGIVSAAIPTWPAPVLVATGRAPWPWLASSAVSTCMPNMPATTPPSSNHRITVAGGNPLPSALRRHRVHVASLASRGQEVFRRRPVGWGHTRDGSRSVRAAAPERAAERREGEVV